MKTISTLGDRVIIEAKYSGKAMYIGPLNDNLVVSELYVGVKLDEYNARFGTGIHNGKYYFEAAQGFGVFVKYDQLAKCKKFDPTVEGGPNKKVLKNQSSLAWLYGQSLDEAEIREYAQLRSKVSSPKFERKTVSNSKSTLSERQHKSLLKEWSDQFGEKQSSLMLENFKKLSVKLFEEDIRIQEEDRLREEQRIKEAELAATDQSGDTCTLNQPNQTETVKVVH